MSSPPAVTVLVPPLLASLLLSQDPAAPPKQLPPGLPAVVAGYAAKIAASAVFLCGRDLDSVRNEEFAPDGALQALARPLLQFDVDRAAKTVTARLLGAQATAAYVPGLGCTLVRDADVEALRARALPPPRYADGDGPWPSGQGAAVPPLPEDVDAAALQAAIDGAFVDRPDHAAARTRAVVVCRRGQLLAERYAAGYDRDSVLPGWSMTKTWVLALLGLRVQDGALDPKAPLPVPEWYAADADPRQALRLDDLLRMQSGLRWSEDYENPASDALRMLFVTGDCGSVAAQAPLAAAPGTVHCYSSGTTNLLCRILRTTFATDQEYLAYPRQRLFAPLAMRSAVLEPDASGTFVGSSFGFATARDWARFGQFLLDDGSIGAQRLLPPGWVAMAREPAGTSRRGDYGAHLWLNAGARDDPGDRPFDRLPQELFYLSGYEGQYVVCFPEQQLVVVRLGCTRRGGFDLHGFLERVLSACGG